jgi:F-type H+-transporting ATPase subunit a
VCFLFSINTAVLAEEERDSTKIEKREAKINPAEVIMEHIQDSHDWHILDYHGADGQEHTVSISLPVILITNGHFDVFMSGAFEHGHKEVIKGDRVYSLEEGQVHEKSGAKVWDISITKNVAAMFASMLALVLIFVSVANSYKKKGVPGGMTSFMEPLILFVRNDIAVPNIGEAKADKFLPYLLTVFFFIWINNLFGLIPFAPFGANVTGNIAFTMVLAVFTLVITNINGNKAYWGHIFAMPGIPKVMYIIMVPVEIIGILTKPFALMIWLFANITAGHILILGLVMLIFLFKTISASFISIPFMVFLSLLEILVGALQAYIFTLLSALFIGMAVAEHEHH